MGLDTYLFADKLNTKANFGKETLHLFNFEYFGDNDERITFRGKIYNQFISKITDGEVSLYSDELTSDNVKLVSKKLDEWIFFADKGAHVNADPSDLAINNPNWPVSDKMEQIRDLAILFRTYANLDGEGYGFW